MAPGLGRRIVVVATRSSDAPNTLIRDAGNEDGTANSEISPDTAGYQLPTE